ncbi:hypothetical protein JW930_02580 [Candidatus Woesearchaeota archaeon]|nr:hypothetical protein [Candidatus Woesearchaeota archaeon]
MKRDEIQHVITGQQITYEGLFSMRELFKFIDSFLRRKGYVKFVAADSEKVHSSSKNVNIKLRPFKEEKGGARREIQITIKIEDLIDVFKDVDGVKINMNKGKVSIVLDAFFIYNQRGKWESRAEYMLIRTIFDKFLFKAAAKDYEGMVKADALELKNELHSFLNLNKFLY